MRSLSTRMSARADDLAVLGIQLDDRVRWRPTAKRAFTEARVTGVEADGSIACVDTEGRARAVMPERLEAWRRNPRGGRRWVPLAGPQQLALFAEPVPSRREPKVVEDAAVGAITPRRKPSPRARRR